MPPVFIDEHIRIAIELALTAGRADAKVQRRQDAAARRVGMTGAEIDAARDGRGFDLRVSAALALVLAADAKARHCQRDRALRAGLSPDQCRAIEQLGNRMVRRNAGKDHHHA